MTYRIKNWSKFQHFKDRRPPWVKLYRELLEDLEWFELEPVAAKNLVNIWLIASENNGELPTLDKLAFRLRLKKQELTRVLSLLGHWLEQDDISVISDRYQSDSTETETETYKTEKEKETDITYNANSDELVEIAKSDSLPRCPYEKIVNLYHEVLPELPRAEILDETRKRNLQARWRQVGAASKWEDQNQGLEWFKDYFGHIRQSKFLMGQTTAQNGRPFRPTIDWITKAENFKKIIEGNYH